MANRRRGQIQLSAVSVEARQPRARFKRPQLTPGEPRVLPWQVLLLGLQATAFPFDYTNFACGIHVKFTTGAFRLLASWPHQHGGKIPYTAIICRPALRWS